MASTHQQQSKSRLLYAWRGSLAIFFLLLSLTRATAVRSAPPQPPLAPLSTEQAQAAWQIRPGYKIELVAAEPLVVDPVAIDWGIDGKLWVAEMADYPLGVDGQGKAGGRIRFLEDTDGDGQYDRSQVFLEGVNFPTGVMAWREGVLVTAAPEVFYAEDTTGDGRADVRRVLVSGFAEDNQQLRVNGLRWGLDNWVYCASGANHGGRNARNVVVENLTGKEISLGARDFRLRPDVGTVDPQSGPSQFGRVRNAWGDWFGVQNARPLWHYALSDHYLRRNAQFAPPDPKQDLHTPTNPRIYTAKRPQKRFHSFTDAGHFTSACGISVYRDTLLFADEQQHAFTCAPFHNLVHHSVLSETGTTFSALRDGAEQGIEIAASSDRWCRPVMTRTGPDGGLWIVDMYRYMIEHPQWLPEVGKQELAPYYRAGDDRGRIWRVVAEQGTARPLPRLDSRDTEGLVAALSGPNGTLRDLAQRTLVNEKPTKAVELLVDLLEMNTNPQARLHALCTLEGIGALTPSQVERALTDSHPAVRRHAIRLAEPLGEAHPRLILAAAALARDPDAKVRQQLAYSLGQWKHPRAAAALAMIAATAGDDPYLLAAAISSVNSTNLGAVVAALLVESRSGALSPKLVSQLVAQAEADDLHAIVGKLMERLCQPDAEDKLSQWQLESLAQSLNRVPLSRLEAEAARRLAVALDRAYALAGEDSEDVAPSLRAAAVGLLLRSEANVERDFELVGDLLLPQQPLEVQLATVDRLAGSRDDRVPAFLLGDWRSYTPEVRREVLGVVASRVEWTRDLLARLEAGEIPVAEIEPSLRQRLLVHDNRDLRARLKKQFAATTNDRAQVLARWQPVLEKQGTAVNGLFVFNKKCKMCHRYRGIGHAVGPDLATISNRSAAAWLESIIDPNRAVESKYIGYAALTVDGRIFTGVLDVDTSTSITLLEGEERRHEILREDLDALRSTGVSLMPIGLEEGLTHEDMADLLAYLTLGIANSDD